MFLNFAVITTYICVGAWTQSYQAFVLRADTAECIHFLRNTPFKWLNLVFKWEIWTVILSIVIYFVLDNCLFLKYTVHCDTDAWL